MDPWRHVDSDDDLVADFLAGTIEVVVEAGGWVHPGAVFVVRDGAASVACEGADGEPLLRVPREAFLHLMRVEWGRGQDCLEVLSLSDDIGDVERELLTLQVAFHNARGAIPALVRTHPALAADLSPDVIDAVRILRPDFRSHLPTPVDLFWTDRAFRVPVVRMDGVTGHEIPIDGLEPVGVPLVDLLDHHSRGATPTLEPDGFAVPVCAPDRADRGPSSCRLDYGRGRDPLDLALVYGFADASAGVGASAGIARPAPDGITLAIAQEQLALLVELQDRAARCPSPAAAILRQAAVLQARMLPADVLPADVLPADVP